MKKEIIWLAVKMKEMLSKNNYNSEMIGIWVSVSFLSTDGSFNIHIEFSDKEDKDDFDIIDVIDFWLDLWDTTPISELDWDKLFEENKEQLEYLFKELNKREHLIKREKLQ